MPRKRIYEDRAQQMRAYRTRKKLHEISEKVNLLTVDNTNRILEAFASTVREAARYGEPSAERLASYTTENDALAMLKAHTLFLTGWIQTAQESEERETSRDVMGKRARTTGGGKLKKG